MFEPFKINRVLPPHELNARRNRKRVVTKLSSIAHLQEAHPHDHKEHGQPNDQVFNHGNTAITHNE